MDNKIIKNIVVVGGGTAGWMSAALLSKSLGCKNYSITLVESEQIATVGVGEATIPMILLFNSVLGIEENEFIRETNATFKLGIEFVNWRKQGSTYFHPFGFLGADMDGIGFMHYWLRWQKQGGTLDYSKFNVETEAARAFKFTRTLHEPDSIAMPKVNYAFQFDASLYAAYLRRYSEKLDVKRVEGKITHAQQDAHSGYIESIVLDNGKIVEGDFFIDCSGFKGLLIEETLQSGYHDWSRWLPANRAAAVPCESAGELLPFTRATAQESGWQWRIPLQHRIGNGYVYSNQFITDEDASDKLMSRLDGKALAEPKTLRFVTGVRKKCWVKNCVAVGLASGFIEPLESTSIHLVQVAITKVLAFFPRDGFSDLLIKRFNDEMEYEYEYIKDLIVAHYKITEREDTPFWRHVKNMDIPDSLATRLEIFKTRGEIMVKQNEIFKETSWFSVLAGQGFFPQSYHPIADKISDDELRLRLTKIRTSVQSRLNTMPTHTEFIRANCKSEMSKID